MGSTAESLCRTRISLGQLWFGVGQACVLFVFCFGTLIANELKIGSTHETLPRGRKVDSERPPNPTRSPPKSAVEARGARRIELLRALGRRRHLPGLAGEPGCGVSFFPRMDRESSET